MSETYAREKVFLAVDALATGRGDLHARLHNAAIQLLLVSAEDLPDDESRSRYANGHVGLMKYVDGVGTGLADTCFANVTVGTNELEIVVQHNDIEVISNGQPVLSYTDPSPITHGGVGVGQIWETNSWYDNVIVRAIDNQNNNNQ